MWLHRVEVSKNRSLFKIIIPAEILLQIFLQKPYCRYSWKNLIAEKLLCKCLDESPLNDSLVSVLIQIEI